MDFCANVPGLPWSKRNLGTDLMRPLPDRRVIATDHDVADGDSSPLETRESCMLNCQGSIFVMLKTHLGLMIPHKSAIRNGDPG